MDLSVARATSPRSVAVMRASEVDAATAAAALSLAKATSPSSLAMVTASEVVVVGGGRVGRGMGGSRAGAAAANAARLFFQLRKHSNVSEVHPLW